MRDSDKSALERIDGFMYNGRYLDANEQLENIKGVIPRAYYKVIKEKILEATKEERGKK